MSIAQQTMFEEYRNKFDEVCKVHASDYVISSLMNNGHRIDLRYSKLRQLIDDFAPLKEQYGLRDGDRVLVLTAPIADAFITFEILACNHLTIVIADPSLPREELLKLIGEVQVSAIFTDKNNFHLVESIDNVPIFQVCGLVSNCTLLQASTGERIVYEPTPDSVAIIFSSGTTDKMKAVEISYESLILCALRNYEVMDVEGRRSRLPFLMMFPMYHISGLACASGMALKGLSIGTAESVSATSLVNAIHMFQPVEFGMIPKVHAMFIDKLEEELKKRHFYGIYRLLRRVSAFFRTELGIRAVGRFVMTPFRKALYGKNMYVILCGGAPCTPEIASAMLDLGVNFVINYSSTECGVPILESGVPINDCLDCVGSIHSDPRVSIRIQSPDDNGIGEVYVKTSYIMKGYYNDPELTKNSFDGEWFKTGDNGFIDEKGYLHIVGRSKDSIMLASGKKVSPDDLENLLLPVIGKEIAYSVVGVTDKSIGCDAIHVFIAGELDIGEKNALCAKIAAWQHTEAPLYPIKEVHFIAELPKTSIGKVKRMKLREIVQTGIALSEKPSSAERDSADKDADVFSTVADIVARIAGLTQPLKGNEDLIHDLGLDSLTIMEIFVEIESVFGISVDIYKKKLSSVTGIAEYISNGGDADEAEAEKADPFNAYDFPRQRKPIHHWLFRKTGNWFKGHIDFEIVGLDKIKAGESYIFCPNHQTHMDGLWVWHALGDKCPAIDQIGCMAKMEHLNSALTRLMLTVLGGIPVDRLGNTTSSFKRSIDFIRAGNSFLIHPEGTRTRNGKLGLFKSGAARMAIESGVKAVPVAIDGGCDVWRYDMKYPKTKDPGTGKKHHVRITFCDPIPSDACSEDEMTRRMRSAIAKALNEED